MRLDGKTVTIYPDIVEASFRDKSQDILWIYFLLRGVDNHTNNGSGWLLKENVLQNLQDFMGIGQSSVYRLLSSGKDKYWKMIGDKIYLIGMKNLSKFLGVKVLQHSGVEVPMNLLEEKSLVRRRALLFGIVVSSKETPQSYDNLADRCNISRRTAIDFIKNCWHVTKFKNYSYITSCSSLDDARIIIDDLNRNPKFNNRRLHIVKDNGIFHIIYQMSNSYKMLFHKSNPTKRRKINRLLMPEKSGVAIDFSGDIVEGHKKYIKKDKPDDGLDEKFLYKGAVNLSARLTPWQLNRGVDTYKIWEAVGGIFDELKEERSKNGEFFCTPSRAFNVQHQ